MLALNKKAPAFSLPDQYNTVHTLEQYRGKWVLLYFYPKDLTPGCTTEACSMRDMKKEFAKRDAVVLGISKDSVKLHKKFTEKHDLNFRLLADEKGEVCQAYEAIGKKRFMGKEYVGIFRISYLINPEGKIAKAYEKVKPETHADEVLKDIDALHEK